ncbi:MAG: glycosyltransferase family 39 protein [Candidatus Methylomirabilales bacterium]
MYLEHKSTKILLALFVLSLSIRLVALWILPPSHLGTNAEIAYLGGARLIVEGEGLSDPSYPVFTPPLYAIMIAGGLYLFGDDQTPIKIAQAIADSLTVVIVYLIAKDIFGHKTAFLSSAILSIYPFSIYPVTYLGPETFFTLFLSLFVLLSLYGIRYEKWQYYVAAGAVLGLATLTRGTTQFYPIFFFLILVSIKKVSKPLLCRYLAFCLAFTSVILPWSLRNYVVLDDFIPVASAGANFLPGCSEKFWPIPESTEEWPKVFELMKSRGIEIPSKDGKPSEKDRFFLKAGLEYCKIRLENEPLSFFPFMLKKFFRLWYATESGMNHAKIIAINILIYLAAAVGILLTRGGRKNLAVVLLGVLGYFVLLHWITYPLFRYMVPVMPYVIAFGSFAIITWLEHFVTGKRDSFEARQSISG